MSKLYKELFSADQHPGSKLNIIAYPAPVLKKIAEPVTLFDDSLKDLIINMFHTMYDAPGIGLAAPQIGVSKRVFVLDVNFEREEVHLSDSTTEYKVKNINPLVYINPKITEKSGSISYEEGCLSFPGVYETVSRYEEIVLEYQDEEGNIKVTEAKGLEAICLQHELDHLNGVVFIEKLSILKQNLIKKKILKTKKQHRLTS